eukprot:Skav215080  [mRNA]  locus=scaffold2575:211054:212637:+ [translate_table: standard]
MVSLWNQNAKNIDHDLDETPTCRQMDITQLHTWEHAVSSGADTVTLSTPCKSFSLGGNQHGWDTLDGTSLAVALQMSKQYGFTTILVENVANLWLDRSFRAFLEGILRFLGLQIAFQRIVTLTNLHPAERSRLLLVLHPSETEISAGLPVLDFLYDLPMRNPMTLWSMDRWMDPPDELLIPMIIPADVLEQYMDKKRLPSTMKNQMQVDGPREVLWTRTIRSGQVMPAGCLMAMYTRQHEFGDKVIYGSLRKHKAEIGCLPPIGPQSYRFLHPGETAVSMGTALPLILPQNSAWSSTAIGNSIAEMHALIGIGVALRLNQCDVDIRSILIQHCQECITQKTCIWKWDREWIQLRHINHEVPIPPTLLDPTQMTCIHMFDDPDEHSFQCWIANGTTVQQLMQAENGLHRFSYDTTSIQDGTGQTLSNAEALPVGDVHISKKARADKVPTGIMCHWTNGICWFNVPDHMQFRQISIQSKCILGHQWTDETSINIDASHQILRTRNIYTKELGFWPDNKDDGRVLVVTIQ